MAEDEKNETTENETPEAVEAEAAVESPAAAAEEPVAAEEEPVAEAPEPEPQPVEPEPQPAEPVAEADEPEAAAEPAPEPAPAAEPAAAAAEAPAQPEPKKKRKRLPRRLRPQKTRPQRAAAGAARKPIVREPKPEHERGRSQERRGVVVSNAMDKTIVVKVDVIKSHPKYKKVVRRSVKFHAHDEQNAANVGDVVRIVETRPLSATKRWRLAEVLEAAK
jgi:small subunit ribosomal protein S17